MKLTPLDIHHKEFKRAIRGYNEEEVDMFLDQVSTEFERIFKENVNLKEEVEKLRGKVDQYSNIEQTLQNTLLTAQKSAEEVQMNAKKEAELVVKDAELKAKQLLDEAYAQRRTLTNTLNNLKTMEEEFVSRFENILSGFSKKVKDLVKEKEELQERVSLEAKKLPDIEKEKPSKAKKAVEKEVKAVTPETPATETKPELPVEQVEVSEELKKEIEEIAKEEKIEEKIDEKQNTGNIATEEEIDKFLKQDEKKKPKDSTDKGIFKRISSPFGKKKEEEDKTKPTTSKKKKKTEEIEEIV